MLSLIRLAWRNIWRNTRRTVITITALGLGVAGIVLIRSYRESMFGEMLRNITAGLVGNIQIHGHGYQDSPSVETVVHNPVAVEATLAKALPGARTERRVLGAGLAGSGDSSAPVMVLGLDPTSEGAQALHTIVAGRDLAGPREVVVGKDLAVDLKLKPGGELVLIGQAADGSVANDRFTVVGLAAASSSELESSAVFLSLKDAQGFFGLEDGVHQIIVRLPTDREDLTQEVSALRGALDLASLEAMSWTEILPELNKTLKSKRDGQKAIDFIIFLIVALGVFNAMTMSTFERTHELGVLAALGTRRGRVLTLILTEAVLQGLVGLLGGVALAYLFAQVLGTFSMGNMSSQDMVGVRLPETLSIAIQSGAVFNAALVALATMLAGALIPAVRAARMRPVDAMRHV
jgi:putative ABC transport system permease protein